MTAPVAPEYTRDQRVELLHIPFNPVAQLTIGMLADRCSLPLPYIQDDFLHYHSVSTIHDLSMTLLSSTTHLMSPGSPKGLSPVCTFDQTTSNFMADIDAFPEPPQAVYVVPYLHDENNSNQRTRNQFRPRNATKGTSSYQLRQYAEATLGGGSLRKIVKLPEGEDENEWLAVNSE